MLQKAWRCITKGLEKYYRSLGEVLQKACNDPGGY